MARRSRGAVASLALASAAALTAAPQLSAQTVISLCYNSQTGVLYVVDPSGTSNLPTGCVNPNHVPLSFVDASGADHGSLAGLADDDHPQYVLADGSRALSGSLNAGGNKVTGLAAASQPGDAVRYDEAVTDGDTADGDVTGTFSTLVVSKLQGNTLVAASPTDGDVLAFDAGSSSWRPAAPSGGGGVVDHGALQGLGDDDHPQYATDDDLELEIANRLVGEAFLNSRIDDETAARIAALQAEAAARATTDAAESAARAAGDAALASLVDSETAARQAADAAEGAARAAADAVLQQNLDLESAARFNADLILQDDLAASAAVRQAADAALQAQIDNLQAQINDLLVRVAALEAALP